MSPKVIYEKIEKLLDENNISPSELVDIILDKQDQIAIIWSAEDVQSVRQDLNGDEAMEVLQNVKRNHDASLGVTWDTLLIASDVLYPRIEN